MRHSFLKNKKIIKHFSNKTVNTSVIFSKNHKIQFIFNSAFFSCKIYIQPRFYFPSLVLFLFKSKE
jgi:hypothetical protein